MITCCEQNKFLYTSSPMVTKDDLPLLKELADYSQRENVQSNSFLEKIKAFWQKFLHLITRPESSLAKKIVTATHRIDVLISDNLPTLDDLPLLLSAHSGLEKMVQSNRLSKYQIREIEKFQKPLDVLIKLLNIRARQKHLKGSITYSRVCTPI